MSLRFVSDVDSVGRSSLLDPLQLPKLRVRVIPVATARGLTLQRAKAVAFFTFLLIENPPVEFRGRQVGNGRDALFHYLRAVYSTPRGHSSNAFDDAIRPGKIEGLQEAWAAYLAAGN